MDFKETYKKYLAGQANDEEKAYIEAEIEKARMVNSEILSQTNTVIKTEEQKIREKKRKNFKQTIKTIIISVVVFFIIFVTLMGTAGILAITNAKNNLKTDETQAINSATECAYIYARDNHAYAGPMEQMVVKKERKELEIHLPFNNCRYSYEFEFIAGYTEIEVKVNASTGECIITDVERLD